jgi:hypothetical protein
MEDERLNCDPYVDEESRFAVHQVNERLTATELAQHFVDRLAQKPGVKSVTVIHLESGGVICSSLEAVEAAQRAEAVHPSAMLHRAANLGGATNSGPLLMLCICGDPEESGCAVLIEQERRPIEQSHYHRNPLEET